MGEIVGGCCPGKAKEIAWGQSGLLTAHWIAIDHLSLQTDSFLWFNAKERAGF
jgi:hypothetical protein